MAEIIEMPKLSDTMVEGVIAAWHKEVGDQVESGELLAEVETDKATMELESFYDGVLLHTAAGESGSIKVGDLMAIIGEKGEDVDSIIADYKAKAEAESSGEAEEKPAEEEKEEKSPAPKQESKQESPKREKVASGASSNGSSTSGGRLKASPLAKKIAEEAGVDIARIDGSGPNGRVIQRDVEAYIENGGASADSGSDGGYVPRPVVGSEGHEDQNVSQMRKTIARRLAESKFTAPHFYLTMEIDMENAWNARKDVNEVAPVKISFNDMIVKAAAAALRQHPQVNSSWMDDHIRTYEHIHVGVAVAVPEGLLVPVIRFADNKGLAQISAETRELAQKARDKKLQPSEWEGNTFTISNLGMFGIEEFTAIINPPDACILAVGAIMDVPVVKDGQVVPGKRMKVTMSCDHRVVDGAVGSAFLQTLKGYLENPVRILI